MNDDDAPRRDARSDVAAGPPAARPPAPKAPASPKPASRVPRPLRWIFDDLGLKLLAFVLAVSTWALVRYTQLHLEEKVPDVAVELEGVPDDVRIVPGAPRVTTVFLSGTTAAVQRAREQLESGGKRIRLRVHDLTAATERRSFDALDDFAFPFEGKQVVKKLEPAIEVRWRRVETLEGVEVAPPVVEFGPMAFEPAPGSPTLDVPKVTVTGPAEVIAALRSASGGLRPDPIDARPWLKLNPDLTTLYAWTKGFAQWRAEDPANRSTALVTISPESVSGKLKVREVKFEPTKVKADLGLLYPPGFAASDYDDFDVRLSDNGYDGRTRKLEVLIRGDASLVKDRKNLNGAWALAVVLPPPPAGAALENEPCPVRLLPLDDTAASDAKARVRLVGLPTIYVSIARKSAPDGSK